jgi:hypothetical protein
VLSQNFGSKPYAVFAGTILISYLALKLYDMPLRR